MNSANIWCWIAPLPADCLDSRRHGKNLNCVRGDDAWVYRLAFYFDPLWFSILVVSKYYCFGPSSGWRRCTLINTILTHEAYSKLLPVLAVCTMMVYRYGRVLDTSTLNFRHPERSSYSLLQSPSVSGLSLATPGRLPKKAPRKMAVTFANMPEKGEAPSSNHTSDDVIM
jgi:hypothetical protein